MNQTILIVDDEPSVRKTVRRALCDQFDVLEADDGESAVRMAATHHPNLIIMDILMPGKDGYTALAEIKRNPSLTNIHVIMLTALTQDLNAKFAEALGAVGYLMKPIQLAILRLKVNQVLGVSGGAK